MKVSLIELNILPFSKNAKPSSTGKADFSALAICKKNGLKTTCFRRSNFILPALI